MPINNADDAKPAGRVPTVLKVYGLLFVTGFCGGYLLGRGNSPNFNDPTNSPPLIRSVVRHHSDKRLPDRGWHIETLSDGSVRSYRPQRVVLTYSCGVDVWTYDSSSAGKLDRVAAPSVVASTPRLGITYPEALGFLLGSTSITAAGTIKTAGTSLVDVLASASLGQRVALAVGGVALTATGVGIGYYFGFDDEIRCGDPLFQQKLNDPVFWVGVANDFLDDHTWKVIFSDQIGQTDPTILLTRRNRHAWDSVLTHTAYFDERELIRKGERFMRIEPYKNQRVGAFDILSEGRLAGILDSVRPWEGGGGVRLSPVNTAMIRDTSYCARCLPESAAAITDGLTRGIDDDVWNRVGRWHESNH